MHHFPSITEDEFQSACQKFYDRATQAPDSHGWLKVANDSGVLSIQKEYLVDVSHGSKQVPLARAVNEEPKEMTDDEDHEVMNRTSLLPGKDTILVEYSVLRSATYEVPVLWLSLRRVPASALNGIRAVYEYLVPASARPGLRHVGVMGGISISNHPVNDLPAFFIHPCNTAKALEEVCQNRACSPEEYFMIWLGLVGPSVNLFIPSQLLLACTGDKAKAPHKDWN